MYWWSQEDISLEASFKSCSTLDIMLRTLLYKLPLLCPQYNPANVNFRHFLGLRSWLDGGLACRFYILTYSKVDMRRDDKKRGVQDLPRPEALMTPLMKWKRYDKPVYVWWSRMLIVISVLDVSHEPSVKTLGKNMINFHLFITNVLNQ